MKKIIISMALCLTAGGASSLMSQATLTKTQMGESLNRGLIAFKTSSGVFVSWRSFEADGEEMTFDLYRDGTKVNSEPISGATCYNDTDGVSTSTYTVQAYSHDALVDEMSAEVYDDGNYASGIGVARRLKLDRPDGGVTDAPNYASYSGGGSVVTYSTGEAYTYHPNDMSVGDVDGDGEYELIVEWRPTNFHDNSERGYTGNVYLDCYKLDGTKLWRIDLGKNIRAGAHYTQFMVYDFDGDGKAELICKTAPGTIDGTGKAVLLGSDSATADYRTKSAGSSFGYILTGSEYLTCFDGATGAERSTIYYQPPRTVTSSWGDSYGNRQDRFLACVAYLDGHDKNPSAVFSRGYYTKAYVWAVDYDGTTLKQRWLHKSESATKYAVEDADGNTTSYTAAKATGGSISNTAYANGNHNLSVGDVDGDGCDEILWGSCAFNSDGTLLYATGYGHGDAIHLAPLDPDRENLMVFQIHEESAAGYGWDVHDARTGEIIFSATGSDDNGRGLAASMSEKFRGFQFMSASDRNPRSAVTGEVVSSRSTSVNFRIYWDGDLYDELFDGSMQKGSSGTYYDDDAYSTPSITKLNAALTGTANSWSFYSTFKAQTCNLSKATPCVQADLFGDWREELVMWNQNDPSEIMIFSSPITTTYRVPTLMEDPIYRLGIAWQNTAYNQPPHLSYYLPDRYLTETEDSEAETWDPSDGATNNIVTLPSITAEFLNNTSKGSTVGAGTWTFGTAAVTTDQNGLEIQFTPKSDGTLVIILGAKLAYNKSVNMFVNGDPSQTLSATIQGQTLASGQTPSVLGYDADNALPSGSEIYYHLEAGKTYNFYCGGTKWACGGFSFAPIGDGASISAITVDEGRMLDANSPAYNVMGLRVSPDTKGILIQNGVKFYNR